MGKTREIAVRILIILMLAVQLPACTSILLGDAAMTEGGASTDDRSSSEVAADDAISTSIRHKLSADPAVNRYAIGVSTMDGTVTLNGTVGSFAARDRAIGIAQDSDGVRSVRNRISVNTNF